MQKKWNSCLQEQHMKMQFEIRTLENLEKKACKKILLEAAKHLNLFFYEMFREDLENAQYLSVGTKVDADSGETYEIIHDIRYLNSSPRIFRNRTERCNCTRQVACM